MGTVIRYNQIDYKINMREVLGLVKTYRDVLMEEWKAVRNEG